MQQRTISKQKPNDEGNESEKVQHQIDVIYSQKDREHKSSRKESRQRVLQSSKQRAVQSKQRALQSKLRMFQRVPQEAQGKVHQQIFSQQAQGLLHQQKSLKPVQESLCSKTRRQICLHLPMSCQKAQTLIGFLHLQNQSQKTQNLIGFLHLFQQNL